MKLKIILSLFIVVVICLSVFFVISNNQTDRINCKESINSFMFHNHFINKDKVSPSDELQIISINEVCKDENQN